MAEQREVRCPQCGETKQNLGNHWRLSASCDYPEPTERQVEIIRGILFSGGNVIDRGDMGRASRNPQFNTTSTRREFINWLDDQFGVMGRGVVGTDETADVRQSFEGLTDDERDDLASKTVYRWRTRNLPFLHRYLDRWYTDGEKTVPPTLSPTPEFLRIVYVKRGNLATWSDMPDHAVRFSINKSAGTLEDWLRFLAPFSPRFQDRHVFITDSRAFFDYIGHDPIPGFEDKWPDDSDNLAQRDEAAVECQTCGGAFDSITTHWQRSGYCNPPPIPDEIYRFLEGILLARGTPVKMTEGYAGLMFSTTDTAVSDWVTNELGSFTNPPFGVETPSGETQNILRTVGHPEFNELHDNWFENGQRTVPDSLDVTPDHVRSLYGYLGDYYDVKGASHALPGVPLGRVRADEDWLLDQFSAYDPVIRTYGARYLFFLDEAALAEALGPAPQGLADRWPQDTRHFEITSRPGDATTDSTTMPAQSDTLKDIFTRGGGW